ncbi:tRNA (guanosine(37)-N1)-methyltransferase TrmD [Corynebacterium sp. sy017]|uniref:tRNA (guanosine(37)-N1)-methyltransferase TrmD n=1 Tax=unclassified Corynebacterium TaxID=2624378 RepID=UPI0011862660|nr:MULTISPECIES: tRNA (guanosine(37)-N1)-methyltransferase TrmD [unclassified Corynebacterium]MBP3087869.1 tRNA (guanosine(37)-N1)-methyltransferase TrmD [Corynebacterium sp. sy017]QDZ42837.1 tRNA (guanosine(37)-N1)-methyltransferase TrmD [Corynebacterium sp. sy039]TSD92410.1 tRNA (guanosine(37)-N1)-methyltransferase TrmD [Corynebacterium sp. SY003]
MQLDVLTIFPAYLDPLRHALLGKAIEKGQLNVCVHDLRAWTTDVHQSVDDSPYGGGPGMVMKPQVWGAALDDVAAQTGKAQLAHTLDTAQRHVDVQRHDELQGITGHSYANERDIRTDEDPHMPLLLIPTPAGVPFNQEHAQAWSQEEHIVFACGRYEGIDQRVIDDARRRYRVREVSIGDYVLIGGEVAVLVIAEAITRLIPGVLGNKRSHEEDSFSDGLLEGPSYTKPRVWRDREVPPVLLSGDHARIARWRREQALERTMAVRPDLIEKLRATQKLSPEDESYLEQRGS